MKVIFLDVDGVLNYASSSTNCNGFVGIDSDKVERLKRIVKATGAKIVLTSTWKEGWQRINKEDQDEMADYLDRKLKREGLKILDKTTDLGMDRGSGIMKWITDHNVGKFVILDDEEFDYAQLGIGSHLVQTSFADGGLQNSHMKTAIELLN